MYISSCCAAAAQRSFAIPDFLLHIFYREEEQQLLTGASKQASRQRGLSTQWEFISKVPDSRLKLMSSCEGKRRRCFAIAALLNWKSNQRLLFYLNMKLNSFKSVVTLHTATTKKWEPSHSLPTFHSPIFHDFPLCLFICLFVTFLHLLTHFLFIFYLFMIQCKKNERKKERLIIYLSQKSLAQRQRLHETLGIKKKSTSCENFKIESEREIFIHIFFAICWRSFFFASSLLREQHARKNKVKNNILTFILLQVEWCSNVNVWLVVWWLNPFLLQCLYKLLFFY